MSQAVQKGMTREIRTADTEALAGTPMNTHRMMTATVTPRVIIARQVQAEMDAIVLATNLGPLINTIVAPDPLAATGPLAAIGPLVAAVTVAKMMTLVTLARKATTNANLGPSLPKVGKTAASAKPGRGLPIVENTW